MKNYKNFSYDKSINEIEKIVENLRTGDIKNFDQMVEDVQKAIELCKICKEKLHTYEEKLQSLLTND